MIVMDNQPLSTYDRLRQNPIFVVALEEETAKLLSIGM